MKSILLASASIVAFAGAAAAEVTFEGSATVGYQDTDSPAKADDDYGFYWDATLSTTFSMELDNGVTAAATFDIDVADDDTSIDLESAGYLFSLTADMGAMYFGETAFAAETYWSPVGDMEQDGFSEADGETVLRGEVMFGGVTAGASYVVADAGNDMVEDSSDQIVDQLSVGATGEFAGFTFAVAYQEESDFADDADEDAVSGLYDPVDENGDFNPDEVFGVRVGATFAGADIALGYAQNMTDDASSLGVQASYPIGPITATAYYVLEEIDGVDDVEDNYGLTVAYASGPIAATADYDYDQGTNKFNVDGSYDIGNGVMVVAGLEYQTDPDKGTDYYAGVVVDLGSGAEVLAAYAEDGDDDDADQEIGTYELEDGITVEASFTF
ncbi:porin [Wenxinia marina]|uniref:Gram-negative porin n=1 Tax=Wenxinia marina DSM 24838 TaxID=1123501 RepID=A0A0D0QDG6_9RHOB|nr:porin [Wenxinia marina]KIQ70372.1 Gram-negative porin [Wenxinia marina DSM 24838]GGL53681.1 porin [Wenxinia marina]